MLDSGASRVLLPRVQGSSSNATLNVASGMASSQRFYLLYLHTHQTLNYLSSPRVNPTCLLPLPHLAPNGARPLYSQPPPLNLPTRNTSRTPRHSQPCSLYSAG